jgi:hypothetical protein
MSIQVLSHLTSLPNPWSALSQLEVVYVVEGLGPAKGDTALQYMLAPGGSMAPGGLAAGQRIPGLPYVPCPHSFAEQVRAERNDEHEHDMHRVLGHSSEEDDDDL